MTQIPAANVSIGDPTKYEKESLKRGLKSRHIQMMAIGSAIGTGLFYGSAGAIAKAGPSIIVTYLLGSFAIWLIMRALGEMAVAEPVSGSYASYANRYIHRFFGFLIGWNPLIIILASSATELNALGRFWRFWFPDVPIWVTSLVAVLVLFLLNVIGVALFGEFEFYFSIIKVVAIIALIVFGVAMIFFGLGNGGQPVGLHNLTENGGFLPHGVGGMFFAMVMVAFAFGGVEKVGIAAGECQDVEKTMPKAVNATFWRLLIFYVGAISILVTLFPWNSIDGKGSPFVQVFTEVGIPAAATIMNLVVITAVFSSMNAMVFADSRLFYNLSLQGNGPKFFSVLNSRKTPFRAILAVFVFMFAGVLLNALMPDQAFTIFSSVTVFGMVCNWGAIVISHLRFRRIHVKQGRGHLLKYKMPLYPYGNYIALAFMAWVVILIAITPNLQVSLLVFGAWLAMVFVAFKIHTRREAAALVSVESSNEDSVGVS